MVGLDQGFNPGKEGIAMPGRLEDLFDGVLERREVVVVLDIVGSPKYPPGLVFGRPFETALSLDQGTFLVDLHALPA